MFSISMKGVFRRPVIVIGAVALKFARNANGRACNSYEAPGSARLFHASVGQRLAARQMALGGLACALSSAESRSAIGAIPEAFLALLARSKSKGEPA
jgi:hypothetical protein